MTIGITGVAAAVAGVALLTGCANTPSVPGASWRMIDQVGQRFATFIDLPGAPRSGDLVTFRLGYVYMPGEVMHEGDEVGWQEYHAVTVNCAEDTVKLGPRTRYAPDGSVIAQDDSQDFAPVLSGTAADDAARAKCEGVYTVAEVVIPDGPNWRDDARRHIADNPPPS